MPAYRDAVSGVSTEQAAPTDTATQREVDGAGGHDAIMALRPEILASRGLQAYARGGAVGSHPAPRYTREGQGKVFVSAPAGPSTPEGDLYLEGGQLRGMARGADRDRHSGAGQGQREHAVVRDEEIPTRLWVANVTMITPRESA